MIANTGKGGVGKTSVSAAMAHALASRGRRVLLMQLNARDRIGAWWGTDPIGPEIRSLAPNIDAVNTTPAEAMREYALMILRVKALYRAVFENRLVEKFLRVVPGLPELVMLGKACFHVFEESSPGVSRYDAVIVDAPATGHGMFLLQIPGVITRAIGSGHMADESRRMLELLRDPARTSVNVVTHGEEMPINETIELVARLRDELDVRVGYVIANALVSPAFTDDELRDVRDLRSVARGDEDLAALLDAATFRASRCAEQRAQIDRARRALGLPVVEVPFYFDPTFDRSVIERMGAHVIMDVERANREAP